MIKTGDLKLPAVIQVEDGSKRVWFKPWKRRPVLRTVFVGFIDSFEFDLNDGIKVVMTDPVSRLERSRRWS